MPHESLKKKKTGVTKKQLEAYCQKVEKYLKKIQLLAAEAGPGSNPPPPPPPPPPGQ